MRRHLSTYKVYWMSRFVSGTIRHHWVNNRMGRKLPLFHLLIQFFAGSGVVDVLVTYQVESGLETDYGGPCLSGFSSVALLISSCIGLGNLCRTNDGYHYSCISNSGELGFAHVDRCQPELRRNGRNLHHEMAALRGHYTFVKRFKRWQRSGTNVVSVTAWVSTISISVICLVVLTWCKGVAHHML